MIKNHDELHEECGVVAIWGDDNAAQLTYYGLHSLQHRGQEAAGIVVRNKSRKLNIHKGEGLVSEVFNKEKIEKARSHFYFLFNCRNIYAVSSG